MEIKYYTHNNIDKNKWDLLIQHSPQSRVFAYSWYLDNMSAGWDALIGGDYEAIFPLPWNNKLLGIKRVIQPRASQQLGLFTLENDVSQEMLHDFLQRIPLQFKEIHLNLNEKNPDLNLNGWKSARRVNMFLSLSQGYEELYSGYSDHHKRNLKKSYSNELHLLNDWTIEDFITFFLEENKGKIISFSVAQRAMLNSLLDDSLSNGTGLIRALIDKTNKLHCAVFLVNSGGRLYYLLPVSSEAGRKSGSMYMLMDMVFKEYSGTSTVFDFEGSSFPGIAKFYKGFGAKESWFYQVSLNRLPFWARWIKVILGKMI